MNRKNYFLITAVLFSVICLLQLLRVILGWDVVVGGWSVPMWLSGIAAVLTGVLAYFGYRLSAREA